MDYLCFLKFIKERKQRRMTQVSVQQRIKGGVLIGIYALYLLAWNLHHFVGHHHHEHDHPHEYETVCAHSDGQTHLHGEDYISEDCALCHFVPTASEIPVMEWSLIVTLAQFFPVLVFAPSAIHPADVLTLSAPRAPPV